MAADGQARQYTGKVKIIDVNIFYEIKHWSRLIENNDHNLKSFLVILLPRWHGRVPKKIKPS